MALRFAYTQYSRRKSAELPLACGALPYEYVFENLPTVDDAEKPIVDRDITSLSRSSLSTLDSLDRIDDISLPQEFDEKELDQELIHAAPITSKAIAIFPQYIAVENTTITIREVDLPRFPASFSVLMANQQQLFRVERERPSFTARQHIVDALTNDTILTVRRDIGKVPRSFRFDDESTTKVLDMQGNCFVPTQGTRATALFTNAVDRSNVKLFMQGSWHNRHAAIKNMATGEVIASMKSELLNLRTLVGSRRTYTVTVSKGMDLAVITAMVVALDARS